MSPPAAAAALVAGVVAGVAGVAGAGALHTQPTLFAMITTAPSGSPIDWQYAVHLAAESLGTMFPGAPTGVGA